MSKRKFYTACAALTFSLLGIEALKFWAWTVAHPTAPLWTFLFR